MDLVNVILNLAALLLWINWRSVGITRHRLSTTSISLASTLRIPFSTRANPTSFLIGLVLLLLVRAAIYHAIGNPIGWLPRVEFGPVMIPFRCDDLLRITLFSVISFGKVLAIFYVCLIFFSAINTQLPPGDPWQRLIRIYVGEAEKLSPLIKLVLPFIAGTVLWATMASSFASMTLLPESKSMASSLTQACLMGFFAYIPLKPVVIFILAMHFFHQYFYIGKHLWIDFFARSGRNLVHPLQHLPLRIGKFDLSAPLALGVLLLVDTHGVPFLMKWFGQVGG